MNLAEESALILLREVADPAILTEIETLTEAHDLRWVFDPEVEGVIGLVHAGTRRAILVCYLEEDDFETASEFDELLMAIA